MWWWFELIISGASAIYWPMFAFLAVRKLMQSDVLLAMATALAFFIAEITTLNNLLDLFP